MCCRKSLKVEEKRTCEPCLTESRSLLAEIAFMYDEELPRHLGQLRGTGYDQVRSSEKPLLGGDALVLAGPGSGGTGARVLTRGELEDGKVQGLDGREHHVDNFAVGAVAVVQVLAQWEDDWRHLRGDRAAFVTGGTKAEVRAAVGYLEVHARWAANEHPDFDGYLDDLRILHGRLEHATGRDERPVKAEASCFDCSGTLLRLRKDGKPCEHLTPPEYPSQYELVERPGRLPRMELVRPAAEVRARYEAELKTWNAEHSECRQGGFVDRWVCSRCERQYGWGRYLLALRGRLEESASGWSLPEHVAHVLEVPAETVRSWAKRGMVATACTVGDRRLRVSYEETADRVRRRREAEERRRERAERRAS
jgi:hypothetical protein